MGHSLYMKAPENDNGDLQADLWTASCQIRALGEMLLHQDTREPAIDEADVWHGYGTLLRQIGERLEAWSKQLDEDRIRQVRRKSR
jgi:hypothetical protein